VKLLRGFKQVSLEAGEKKRVEISCQFDRLRWYNPDSGNWELEEMEYEVYIGNSSCNQDLLQGSVSL
ncbi:MAG TPA: fibronectin type III-like domain-contianing protein, partial [Halanaerobiales bacterium]|nr:fibronectin type III-like domain-contianing protein [Halanaerobiales bacterium]